MKKELQKQDSRLSFQIAEKEKELQRLRGDKISSYNMMESEELEMILKCMIEAISLRKVRSFDMLCLKRFNTTHLQEKLRKKEMDVQKEQRLCVICQVSYPVIYLDGRV